MTPILPPTGLSPEMLALAAAMTLVASAIRGLTGFGMAIVLVPLLGMIMRPEDAVVLAIILQFIIGPVGMRSILAEADRPSALKIAAIAMATTPIGVWLLANTPPDVARAIIACIAICAFLLVAATFGARERPTLFTTMATGAAAGVLTGFAAMPGPPVVPYYLRAAFSPHEARGSMMLIFFATAIAGTISALAIGLVSAPLVWLSVILTVPMLVGNALGGLAFGRVPDPAWRGLVALLLGVAGIAAVARLIG